MFVEDQEEKLAACTPALQEIVEEFAEVTPMERLQLLLEYANDLPDLPARLEGQRDSMEQVHECQTQVFMHSELEGDKVRFFFDIPRESPTVRGYVSILVTGLADATVEQVLGTPEDYYLMLGLQEAITPQRLRGLYFMLFHMKRQVVDLAREKNSSEAK